MGIHSKAVSRAGHKEIDASKKRASVQQWPGAIETLFRGFRISLKMTQVELDPYPMIHITTGPLDV